MVSGVDGSVPRRSDPAVRQRSRPADSRHFDRRQGDQDSSLLAVKSTRVETTGHPEGEGPFQGSCQHNVKVPTGIITPSVRIPLVKIRGVLQVAKMACVSSKKSSFQQLYDAPLQTRTSPTDDNITSHVCGFCATSLGVWSSSRLAHQATHQSFPVGTSGATQNHAQVGPSSCVVIIAETTIRIRRWCWRGILGWRHSRKLADHKMCVPVSIGFGKTALIPARFECRARQMCVRQRKHTATTSGISVAGTWFPSKESATELGPWMDHHARDCPLESDGSGENAVSCQTIETLHMGFWKNRGGGGGGGGGGGMSADVYTLESQHQRYYEEPHKPMDRGDCQGSLHSSWLRIWPSDGTMRSEPFQHHGRTTIRLPFLTSCQRHFGGHLGSSRIRIYATWPVSLMACRQWVQWWSHNK